MVIVVAALVGMTVSQLPSFATGPNAAPSDYATQMALIHQRYDATLGVAVVNLFERLGFFEIFSTAWFGLLLLLLFLSIVVCTLDRTPRLWRDVHTVHVVQPDPYFDPRLPGRAATDALDGDAVRGVLRRHHFRVREVEAGGFRYLYGDRNQYTRLATLLTHLGLILFIAAAAISAHGIPQLGIVSDDRPLVLATGDTATVQPIGTPGLLIVKNLGFSAPLLPNGMFADFTTDLAVYQDGRLIARKTIRVNDPLTVDGYTFHQNFFGPAADLLIRDSSGAILWSGPVPLDDSPAAGHPYRQFVVPGREVSLDLLLDTNPDGSPLLLVVGNQPTGVNAAGQQQFTSLFAWGLTPGVSRTEAAQGFTVTFQGMSSYTGVIAKKDPGQELVWIAFLTLITGLAITFYLPRRRVWARVARSGELRIAGRSDRYVDFGREFAGLLEDLVAARRPGSAPSVPSGP